MKFTLEMNLDTAAFESQDFANERDGVMIGITLKQIAHRLLEEGDVSALAHCQI